MNRTVLGALAALLLVAAGIFWWQGRAETQTGAAPPDAGAGVAAPDTLPLADANGMRGAAPPEATEVTREQHRFDRIDHNRDGRITRNEMLAARAAAFRKLDVDRNNLLTFEEWAVRTSNRFKGADGNGDSILDRPEFATTKPKAAKQPQCRCAPAPRRSAATPRRGARAAPVPAPPPDDESVDDDAADPEA